MPNTNTITITCSLYTQMDATLLAHGAFKHLGLTGFMDFNQWKSVCETSELPSGALIGLPMTLPVPEEALISPGTIIKLATPTGLVFAKTKAIDEPFFIDPKHEAINTLGSFATEHPYFIQHLKDQTPWRVSTEPITLINNPTANSMWQTPEQIWKLSKERKLSQIVAFQTKNPLHFGHIHFFKQLLKNFSAILFHPAMGPSLIPTDTPIHLRAASYEMWLKHLPQNVLTSFAPIAMRMAGPREALWNAQIHYGYGAHAFAVGHDHAGFYTKEHADFYKPLESLHFLQNLQKRLPIKIIPLNEHVFSLTTKEFKPKIDVLLKEQIANVNSAQIQKMIENQKNIPEWLMPSDVSSFLQNAVKKGKVVLLTGLSGAGKTELANAINTLHKEQLGRPLSILDGDVMRQNLTKELGFSKEDRIINIQRIGFVAKLLAEQGANCCISAIAPYYESRKKVYDLLDEHNIQHLTVYVNTPISVCTQRDPKGLYEKAIKGVIPNFTGISDPYEEPNDLNEKHLKLDLSKMQPMEAARFLFNIFFI